MAWTHEQLHNARIIESVGQRLGASQRDIQIALMVALTESGLRNVHYGDRDSLGVFQQRAAWGSSEQRLNVADSAAMFFQGGHAGQRGLFDFHDRSQMTMGEAAQAVQVSAFPDRYAEHTQAAAQLLSGHTGTTLNPNGLLGGIQNIIDTTSDAVNKTAEKLQAADPTFATDNGSPSDPNYMKPAVEQTNSGTAGVGAYAAPMSLADIPNDQITMPQGGGFTGAGGPGGAAGGPGGAWRGDIRQFARKFLGTPYVWGGTTPAGFDCSGFVQYVYKHALGIDLPRISYQQATSGKRIGLDNLRVGDLVGWDNSSRNPGADHIAIYIGHGRIIEAPRPGLSVQISNLYDQGQAWGVRMHDG